MQVLNTISPTQLDSYHACRLQWYWTYPMGYRRVERSMPLDLGIGIHEALKAHYSGKGNPVKVLKRWVEKELDELSALEGLDEYIRESAVEVLEAVADLGVAMIKGYLQRYAKEQLTVLEVEKRIERPIPGTQFTYNAKVDALVRYKPRKNRIYVLEHKTFTRFYPDFLSKNHQFVGEKWVAETLTDEEVDGVIYNGLRKQAPGDRVKLDLYERHVVRINDHQVKMLIRRLRAFVRDITAGKFAIYPEPQAIICSSCAFKSPCDAYMRGEDYQFILDNAFTRRPDSEVEEVV